MVSKLKKAKNYILELKKKGKITEIETDMLIMLVVDATDESWKEGRESMRKIYEISYLNS